MPVNLPVYRAAGRYAPSPSGDLHLGNLRTALLAWAFARYDGRKFFLRIEDLDARSRPEHEASQLRDLEALGIDWDGTPVRQSERLEIYQEIFQTLQAQDLLYECYCTRKDLNDVASAPHRPPGSYPGTCRNLSRDERKERAARLQNRKPAWRLKTDIHEMTIVDRNYGAYRGAIDDLVILRGDGVFSYNFVSVVDDALMGVGQIVRGDDLLPSVPRQIYLQQMLGYPQPEYAHVPLVLNQDGIRLAKRDGAVTLRQLLQLGLSVGDLLAQMSISLGFPGVRNAQDFREVFLQKILGALRGVFTRQSLCSFSLVLRRF
ncbi:tRNA glutamyl-Q(34) synthetase GluQRS [Arcanobacterium hippocoleae]|uniref:tRNA glutamyl-Q(34) synthetase GluQRS n=1 Tax=Arcanobacterium hippocoleae TaxID=149017 RepID=UPI00333E5039